MIEQVAIHDCDELLLQEMTRGMVSEKTLEDLGELVESEVGRRRKKIYNVLINAG